MRNHQCDLPHQCWDWVFLYFSLFYSPLSIMMDFWMFRICYSCFNIYSYPLWCSNSGGFCGAPLSGCRRDLLMSSRVARVVQGIPKEPSLPFADCLHVAKSAWRTDTHTRVYPEHLRMSWRLGPLYSSALQQALPKNERVLFPNQHNLENQYCYLIRSSF